MTKKLTAEGIRQGPRKQVRVMLDSLQRLSDSLDRDDPLSVDMNYAFRQLYLVIDHAILAVAHLRRLQDLILQVQGRETRTTIVDMPAADDGSS